MLEYNKEKQIIIWRVYYIIAMIKDDIIMVSIHNYSDVVV